MLLKIFKKVRLSPQKVNYSTRDSLTDSLTKKISLSMRIKIELQKNTTEISVDNFKIPPAIALYEYIKTIYIL